MYSYHYLRWDPETRQWGAPEIHIGRSQATVIRDNPSLGSGYLLVGTSDPKMNYVVPNISRGAGHDELMTGMEQIYNAVRVQGLTMGVREMS